MKLYCERFSSMRTLITFWRKAQQDQGCERGGMKPLLMFHTKDQIEPFLKLLISGAGKLELQHVQGTSETVTVVGVST